MLHWMTDAVIPAKGTYGGGFLESIYAFYHLLRTMGWSPIWECDGEDAGTTHIDDGNMEDAGIAAWTGGGVGPPVVVKDTSNPHMGRQCLSFDPQAANDYVVSNVLLTMSNSQQYELVFYALNDNDTETFDVEVDTGTGSWTPLGTIPANPGGSWTKFHFSFTTHSSGNRYIRFKSSDTPDTPFLIDSVFIFRSWYEYYGVDAEDLSATPDGQIQNNDEFVSGSYSFQAGDVGKYICIFDPTNLGNTGCYRISAVAAGVATVDVRTSGVRNLTSQTGLRWRMIDAANGPAASTTSTASEHFSGWGLQSPHANNWRLFARGNWYLSGVNYNWCEFWTSVFDIDFDVETGQFIGVGAQTTLIAGQYIRNQNPFNFTDRYAISGDIGNRDCTSSRAYMMTDGDGSFVCFLIRPDGGAHTSSFSFGLVGFTGADELHTLNESFVCLMQKRVSNDDKTDLYFDGDLHRFHSVGAQVGRNGMMYRCTVMTLGYAYGASLGYLDANYNTFARANPFDGQEWLQEPRIARDYFCIDGDPSEKSVVDLGQWMGRGNFAQCTAFDSNTRFCLQNGWYWTWPGFAPVA